MKPRIIIPFLILISIIIIILLINSCRHDTVNLSQVRTIYFDTEVLPIFQTNCAIPGCHNGSGRVRSNFSTYNGIMRDVVPGKPYSSNLYTRIVTIWTNPMPPKNPLEEKQRTLIRVWIEQGAKNNHDTTKNDTTKHISNCDTTHITFSGTIKKILNDNCFACHSNASAPSSGNNIKLEDSSSVVAKYYRLLGSIEHKPGYFAMPLGGLKLDTCKITQFAIWLRKVKPNASGCDTNHITFSGTLNQILNDNCLTCHSNANAPIFGFNIKLEDSVEVVAKHDRFLGAIEHKPGYFAMPKGGMKLDTCKIIQFSIWLRKSKPVNILCDTNHITFSGTINNILSNNNCISCHSSANAANLGAGILLEDSTEVAAMYNRIMGAIEQKPTYYSMPKNGPKMDTCSITQFGIWLRYIKPVIPVENYPVCFSRDILPVIQSNCAMTGCHNGSNGELNPLNNYSDVMQIVEQPGNPGNCTLYRVITNGGENKMPPSGYNQLSSANIDSIRVWITAGASNPSCPAICDSSKFAFSANVFPVFNNYCKGCHSGSNAGGGIHLEDYTTITNVPSAELIGAITGQGYPKMPLTGSLTDCQVAVIKNWINNGEKNN